MISLCPGLRNSLVVLELLREKEALAHLNLYVQTFHNCREMGLTFTLHEGPPPYRTYCVYEHRNSDEIIVNHSDGWVGMGGSLPYQGDKYTYDKAFKPGEYDACAEFLAGQVLAYSHAHAQGTG